jgi:hypothetical protein
MATGRKVFPCSSQYNDGTDWITVNNGYCFEPNDRTLVEDIRYMAKWYYGERYVEGEGMVPTNLFSTQARTTTHVLITGARSSGQYQCSEQYFNGAWVTFNATALCMEPNGATLVEGNRYIAEFYYNEGGTVPVFVTEAQSTIHVLVTDEADENGFYPCDVQYHQGVAPANWVTDTTGFCFEPNELLLVPGQRYIAKYYTTDEDGAIYSVQAKTVTHVLITASEPDVNGYYTCAPQYFDGLTWNTVGAAFAFEPNDDPLVNGRRYLAQYYATVGGDVIYATQEVGAGATVVAAAHVRVDSEAPDINGYWDGTVVTYTDAGGWVDGDEVLIFEANDQVLVPGGRYFCRFYDSIEDGDIYVADVHEVQLIVATETQLESIGTPAACDVLYWDSIGGQWVVLGGEKCSRLDGGPIFDGQYFLGKLFFVNTVGPEHFYAVEENVETFHVLITSAPAPYSGDLQLFNGATDTWTTIAAGVPVIEPNSQPLVNDKRYICRLYISNPPNAADLKVVTQARETIWSGLKHDDNGNLTVHIGPCNNLHFVTNGNAPTTALSANATVLFPPGSGLANEANTTCAGRIDPQITGQFTVGPAVYSTQYDIANCALVLKKWKIHYHHNIAGVVLDVTETYDPADDESIDFSLFCGCCEP